MAFTESLDHALDYARKLAGAPGPQPAVTSAIIGPRTMEQLEGLLGADEVRLPVDVLDRIDELVPVGTTVRAGDDPYEGVAARRRPRD